MIVCKGSFCTLGGERLVLVSVLSDSLALLTGLSVIHTESVALEPE